MAGKVLIRERACTQCGTSPITGYKFCSDKCRERSRGIRLRANPKPRPPAGNCSVDGCVGFIQSKTLCAKHYQRQRSGKPLETKCEHCEAPTPRPRFCSTKCSLEARARRRGVMPWDERKALEKSVRRMADCISCGVHFHARHSSDQKFCSDECRVGSIRKYSSRAEARKAWKARAAERAYEAGERRRASDLALEAKARKDAIDRVRSQCADCSGLVEGSRRHTPTSVCLSCAAKRKAASRAKAKRSPASRASRARSKATRRMRMRAARIERFDPFDIFERDKWRCHMCGCSTPKRLRGTFEPNAPELDHVIPLAAGGEHSRRNTACSCRKCNIEKADKPIGQLSLAI